ncbi:hypothetical protein CK203_097403 [Vitis vinifera]|uniref:Uncharacterized protein n=1 Tax=Vitis vinifera TaxID=29760 RepID=A0A438D9C8_VITVI|nr:hypothetical protein CK203_097403 [Vitis vinifera]
MEGPEGFNDWEQIQSPGSQIPPPTAQSRHWAMTVIKDDFYKDRSVFPPGDHEGLRISSQDTPQPDSLSPSLSPRLPPVFDVMQWVLEDFGHLGQQLGGGRGAVAVAVVVVLVGSAVASAAGRGEESFGPLAQRERPAHRRVPVVRVGGMITHGQPT